MMSTGKLLSYVSFAVCLMLPAAVFSDVKIVLKNGRSISAESCQEKAGEFVCSRGGGFFSIEKSDIAEIKGIPRGSSDYGETAIRRPSGEGVKDESHVEKNGGEQNAGALRADLEKRLGEITQRKKELKKERAKLVADRQKLKAELAKTPDWMTTKQFADLSGRVTDLDNRLKRFNEEVSRLNIEEKNITDQLEGKSAQPEKRPERD
jgi:hypothetical protein